jgi:uncharacterized damage-inducible protein DinB
MKNAREVRTLIAILDQAYDRRSWHGTNLRGSIRGLSPEVAAWRPASGRHNVWETVVHAAYWKYAVWRRLSGAARGSFPEKGSNWFERPRASGDAAWSEDVALLHEMHHRLREAALQLDDRDLARRPRGGTVTAFALLSGIAAHDLYHAGQIQLLKRLASN